MGFWLRHIILILACVVAPFTLALYFDTASEVKRVEHAGGGAAKLASQGLEARLTLLAHRTVSHAISVAQRIGDRDLVGELSKPSPRHDASFSAVVAMLNEATPQGGGFAWLIDENGAIVGRNNLSVPETNLEKISGHPLFLETQEGYAVDGLWRDGQGQLALVGASPVVVHGQAQGALFIGQTIRKSMLDELSAALNAGVTLTQDDQVVVSTLEPEAAEQVVKAQGTSADPVSSGALSEPLHPPHLPLLPLFIDHYARNLAYMTMESAYPGGHNIHWFVSVDTGSSFVDLPGRQEQIILGMLSFVMFALLFGLMYHRSFVSPINKITEHLSELQLGRGEMELPEAKVAAPFRRMVRLINMTVQKIPARGFSGGRASGADGSISDIGPGPLNLPSSNVTRTLDIGDEPIPSYQAPPNPLGEPFQMPPPVAAPPPARRAPDPVPVAVPRERAILSENGALEAAVAQLSKPSHPSPGVAPSGKPASPAQLEEADAVAQALAALEGPGAVPLPGAKSRSVSGVRPSATSLEAPKLKKQSAADIRGVPSQSIGMASPGPTPGYGTRGVSDEQVVALPGNPRGGGAIPLPGAAAAPALAPGPMGNDVAIGRAGGSLDVYSALGSTAGVGAAHPASAEAFNPEATVVAPVQDELLRKTVSRDTSHSYSLEGEVENAGGSATEMTMVASVPANLLAQTISNDDEGGFDVSGLDAADQAHFKETYERFLDMRKRCGETIGDLAFDRFLAKLAKNREGLIKKYNCRTVRFQVYEKDGKAALKATPVRAR